jgi:SPIRAL1-like protein
LQPELQSPAGLVKNAHAEKVGPVAVTAASVSRQNGKAAEESAAALTHKLGRNFNNYHRADGQNTGNFITDRPSTKVHAAPGGGSSLGYLFGGGN